MHKKRRIKKENVKIPLSLFDGKWFCSSTWFTFNKSNFKVKFNFFFKIHFLSLLGFIFLSLYIFLIISLTWFNYVRNRAIWNWFSYQYFLSFVLPNNHSMAVFGWKYWQSKRGWALVGSSWFWRERSRLTILALLLGDWGLTRGGCGRVDLGHDD